MSDLSKFTAAFEQFRALINAELEPASGVWGTKVPIGAAKAQIALMVILIAAFLGVAMTQEHLPALWNVSAFFMCGTAAVGPGTLLGRHLEKKSSDVPARSTFFGWLLASMLLGIPVGHLALFALGSVYPLGDTPIKLTYIPEAAMLVFIAYSYWRLLYVRQWQYRLDTEQLKREAAEHGQALAQAQLKMLQAQIEPHFLFNTLASVQQLVRKDAQLADFLLTQLIRYLRDAMPDIRGAGSTLGREFGLVEAYLNIARVRMGGRLEVDVTIPEALADISFPPLVTHTLVENAIKHGVEPKPGPVKISVTAAEIQESGIPYVEIQVVDNGVGFGGAETMGTGVGLRNIRERLAGLYGGQARLDVTGAVPDGVCATVRFPKFPKSSK